jgi:hypothetical protein
MFEIGDYVLNQRTQHIGQIVGYGNRSHVASAAPGVAFPGAEIEPTLKVLISYSETTSRRGFIEEAPCSVWTPWQIAAQRQAS